MNLMIFQQGCGLWDKENSIKFLVIVIRDTVSYRQERATAG